MTCPLCGGKTKVKDVANDIDIVIRKRECLECNKIFYTKEIDFDNEKEAHYILNEIRYKERKNEGKNKK